MLRLLFIIIPIVTIVVIIFVSLFTPYGSNLTLKPIANSYLNQKIKNPSIDITKLDSKVGYIDIDAKSDNGVSINTKGDVNYLNKDFDLNYKLNARSVRVDNRDIKLDLNVLGQAVGSSNNFGVTGSGNAFDSDISYKLIIKNDKPQDINIDINSAQISKIFALLNITPYLDGQLFLNSKMSNLDLNNPTGKAYIEIRNGILSTPLINKLYNLKLPKNETIKAKIDATVTKKYIISRGDINSTTAKIEIKKITSTLDLKQAKGYFKIDINNLARLNGLSNLNLKGKITTDGIFYSNSKKKQFQLNLTTKDLGGVSKFKYSKDTIKATLKNFSPIKLFSYLSMPKYISEGKLNGALVVKNFSNPNGKFALSTDGTLNKKLLKVKLPSYRYTLQAKGSILDGKLKMNRAKVSTNFIKLYLEKLSYSLVTDILISNFSANIDNLKALKLFTGLDLRGALKVNGKIKKIANSLNVVAGTKSLSGDLKINYKTDRLHSNFKKLEIAKILYTLNMPHYIVKSNLSGKVDITDLNSKNGIFSINSVGLIDTKTLKKHMGLNLGDRFKYILKVNDGVIKNALINFKPKINTSIGSINFDTLKYNLNSNKIDGEYRLDIKNLKKLEPLINQKLIGSFALKGSLKKDDNQLLVTAVAKELGGVINFIMNNNKIKVNAAGLSVIRVLRLINQEEVIDGVAQVDLNYNTKSKQGEFSVKLDESRFLNSKLVNSLKQVANFDLSKELFSSANIDGTINNNIIKFNLNTASQRVKLSTYGAKIDIKSSTVDAKIKVSQKNQDYLIRVTGSINNPTITPIFDGYIKKKVINRVEEKLKDLGIDKEINKIVPNEIKNIEDNESKRRIKKVIPNEIKGLFKGIF